MTFVRKRVGILDPVMVWARSAAVYWTFAVIVLLLLAVQGWLFQHKLETANPLILTDFNDYHVVGRMVAEGRAGAAYSWPMLKTEQVTQTGAWAFMPWAYPPQFTQSVALLGLMPLGLAYFVFTGVTWLFFAAGMHRLCKDTAIFGLLMALPAIMINAKCGQSGFLSAGLITWFCVGLRRGSNNAGWALGAMIFKPHLAAGIGLLTVLERRWGAILRAIVLVLALTISATAFLGAAIWAQFPEGTRLTSEYLWNGEFPLERMTSVFAMFHRFGLAPTLGMTFHVAIAGLALALLIQTWRKGVERESLLAIAVAVSLSISPYTYDYDMVSLAIVFGLLWPAIQVRAGLPVQAVALALSWIATSNYLWIGLRQIWYHVPTIEASMGLWTISPIALALLAGLITQTVSKQPRAGA